MHQVATALIFDCNGQLLIYLRDEKPDISYPGYWDLFGGRVEPGETPEQALIREVEEELGILIDNYSLFKTYESHLEVDPNVKYVYVVHIPQAASQLTLYEGQYHLGINLSERHNYAFANMLGLILDDYANSVV